MPEPPNVLLHLPNKPENVLLVREMLSGLAQAIELDPGDLNDIHTAVTEACNNVVMHAYGGEQGPMEVEVCLDEDKLEVIVRDHGRGMREREQLDGSSMGIGLPVIGALTQEFQLEEPAGGGAEVQMRFLTLGTRPFESSTASDFELPRLMGSQTPSTMAVSVVPPELARPVLARLLSAVAAVCAHFSTDQISDVQMVSDALVAHVPGLINGNHLNVAVSVEPRNLELKIGPLGLGSSQRLIGEADLQGIGGVIEKLSDRHAVAKTDSYEVLTLGLVGRR
jgi:serine/threonine-protein kinase RsbW